MDSVADMLLGWDCPGGSVRRNPCASVGDGGDTGLTHGSGRSPREGNGNPFQYSCQDNPMDRGAWQAIVHGVTKSWTLLSDFQFFAFQSCRQPH